VEKPLADDLGDVRSVLARAQARGLPMACGFVERFNPVVRCAADLLHDEPVHVLAVRHSPPNGRATANVVQDLLIHDIDLAVRFAGGSPLARVTGAAWAPPGSQLSELADATLRFDHGMVATLSASRVGQRKVRAITVTTAAVAVELDLLRQDISVYRHRAHEQVVDDGLAYRTETVIDIPFVRHVGEPLALQLEHFLDLLEGRVDADEERASVLAPHVIAAAVEGQSLRSAPASVADTGPPATARTDVAAVRR
jgi:predicted dehydrogenase